MSQKFTSLFCLILVYNLSLHANGVIHCNSLYASLCLLLMFTAKTSRELSTLSPISYNDNNKIIIIILIIKNNYNHDNLQKIGL